MYLSSLTYLPHRHDPPPCHTYIYIEKNTDQYLTLLTIMSCLLGHLHGSLTCIFTVHHKHAVHDSQRLTDRLYHHSEHGYQAHTTEPVQGLYGVTTEAYWAIQVRHVCEIYGWCFIDTCIWLRSSFLITLSQCVCN